MRCRKASVISDNLKLSHNDRSIIMMMVVPVTVAIVFPNDTRTEIHSHNSQCAE